ncbi:MAG: signal recognition particle-docking protein FtsY [Nannocystaceae bacterium]|nr:signal recognition particle-docking protein FtsY [bacterium]
MDPLLIIALVVAVVAAAGFVVLRRRDPALTGSVDLQLPPSPAPATDDSVEGDAAEDGGLEALPERVARPTAPKDRDRIEQRYRDGLAKTRGGFVAKLASIFKSAPKVDDDLRDQVEEVLFTSDIGTQTAQTLLDQVTGALDRDDVADADAVWGVIRAAALDIVDVDAAPQDFAPDPGPYVLLMVGVNGVGKTTTLGKLAARHAAQGRKVLLVAADTFRAAAVEQLEVWAQRVGCGIHKGADKADPSSVIFDGIRKGREEGYDVVLCDTAGRLQTRTELMDELQKVGRAAGKAIRAGTDLPPDAGAHDTFLVLDATIGQNALSQAKVFKETMDFTGLVVTKLDGTAKGGVVLGICDELGVPIRHIGIGEGIDDLRDFEPRAFVDALFFDEESA